MRITYDYLIQIHFQCISLFVPCSCPRKNGTYSLTPLPPPKEIITGMKGLSLIYLFFVMEVNA